MTQLSFIPTDSDDTPLPLIVAKRWQFPLAHVETEEGIYYAVQDWMRGIIGGDVRKLWWYLCDSRPELNKGTKIFSYKTTDSKTHQRPYTDEASLISLLVYFRILPRRNRLVEIRNFVANFAPNYEYLRCSPPEDHQVTEAYFQSQVVEALRTIFTDCEVREYYSTPLGYRIDVLTLKQFNSKQDKGLGDLQSVGMLIECKVDTNEFYKAVGQITCYKAELSWETFDTTSTRLAIAMPYNDISDYMRNIAQSVGFDLISVVDGFLVDALSGASYSV